jgi:tetratricopeptide (TPR) repeat protein
MTPNKTDAKPLTLQLVEDVPAGTPTPSPEAGAEGAKSGRDLRITTSDEFLAAAAHEYEKGQVDPALWARSASQAGGDESLAIAAYLKARATALQLARREQRAEKPVDAAQETKPAETPRLAGVTKDASVRRKSPRAQLDPRLLYGASAAAVLIVVFGAWLVLSSDRDDTPAAAATSPAAGPAAAGAAPRAPAAPLAAPDTGPSLAEKVAELQKAGNWNVLVLYAVEWTRKEPANATAWTALSVGYGNLRQYDEALDAANKAVKLVPNDPASLRNLARLDLTLDRLPEAAAAFDRLLAVSGEDVEGLCGAAEVAQKQRRPTDADAFLRRVAAANARCDSGDRPAFAPSAATRKAAR